jgi:hypothetical protein
MPQARAARGWAGCRVRPALATERIRPAAAAASSFPNNGLRPSIGWDGGPVDASGGARVTGVGSAQMAS